MMESTTASRYVLFNATSMSGLRCMSGGQSVLIMRARKAVTSVDLGGTFLFGRVLRECLDLRVCLDTDLFTRLSDDGAM